MIRDAIDVIMAITLAALIGIGIYTGVEKKDLTEARFVRLEQQTERLEQRVGALCVIVYGKSTGFDKAMVRGKDER